MDKLLDIPDVSLDKVRVLLTPFTSLVLVGWVYLLHSYKSIEFQSRSKVLAIIPLNRFPMTRT